MRTHLRELDAWIESLPEEQRYGARRLHAEWAERAKGRETALLNQLVSISLGCMDEKKVCLDPYRYFGYPKELGFRAN